MNAFLKLPIFALLFSLAACGGGGGGGGTMPGGGGGPTPTPTATPTPVQTATPIPRGNGLASSAGRIAPFQVFDAFPPKGPSMPTPTIIADASRYTAVWGSFNPGAWYTGNPATLTSTYYIPLEDSVSISGHNLAWWQANHPDWILYTCDSSNNPTKNYAYITGVGFPDVPLDIHNPAVIDYQVRQSLAPYLISNNYRAAAFDQINFNNITVGGNPELGQQIVAGNYGCGVYSNGTFVRRYSSRTDPQYAADVLNWLHTARTIFTTDPTIAPFHLEIFVNHGTENQTDPNEIALLSYVDMEMYEPGFSDYGAYQNPGDSHQFGNTVNWMEFLQSHGVAIGIIDKFDHDTSVSQVEEEYSIATYLMGNETKAYLFTAPNNGPTYGYGTEQWHPEYTAPIGNPCGPMYGGPIYDKNNPQIFYRRFQGGISVVNSGSLPTTSETATLPTNHVYSDLFNRLSNPVPNTISVASNDAYVLMTGDLNGCN